MLRDLRIPVLRYMGRCPSASAAQALTMAGSGASWLLGAQSSQLSSGSSNSAKVSPDCAGPPISGAFGVAKAIPTSLMLAMHITAAIDSTTRAIS